MTLIDKLKVPVFVAGLGLAGIAGCSKEGDISKINLDIVNNKGKLTESSIDWLKARNVNIDSAKAYDRRFLLTGYVEDIVNLFNRGIMPGVANEYNGMRWFNVNQIIELYEQGITPEIVNAYDNRFDAEAISTFFREGVSPDFANSYDKNLFDTIEKIVAANNADLDNQTALEYNERFDLFGRVDLYANGVFPEVANSYHKSFSDDDIIALYKRGRVSSKIANRYARLNELYGASISADDIIRFVEDKVPYSAVEKRAKQLMIDKSITER